MVLLLQVWQADENGVKTCLFSSEFRWANEISVTWSTEKKNIEEVWAQPLANFFCGQAADKLFSA